ncbi:MAG: hypothetical protein AseanaTS_28350 [Candidatus Pelagadaptatus aseana]|uniref:alginate export family protein n=1 Tax=Candidatus Pelagadaptatus aseana TaxID=3120508 RepID=UPI0039B317B2
MKTLKTSLLSAAITAAVLGQTVQVHAADSIAEAVKEGKASISFRLRHEDVDVDNASEDNSTAQTLKTRLNYKTGDYKGFTAFVELDDVTALGDEDYATSKALKLTGNYPGETIIADPEGTEVNQAYLAYTGYDSVVKYGRQRILLDNQRFVGGVGFRQNEQTYDAISITNNSITDTTVFYAHIDNVNRIFGEDDPAVSDTESSTDLLNIKYAGLEVGTLTFYSYLLDETDADTQYDTYGLRFAGKTGAFGYALEYATQDKDLASGVSYDADYMLAEGSFTVEGVKLTLGYESLGSDNGDYGFSTPLATGHKFQGWADQFLSTPDEGINDLYFSVGGKIAGVKVLAVYHDFTADEDNASSDDDLGSEYGILIAKKFGNYGLSAKYASYSEGDDSFGKADVDKLWITATASF